MNLAQQYFEDTSMKTALIELMWIANKAILEVYHSDNVDVDLKSDASPVTQADLAAHEVLLAGLQRLTPDIPVVSEEDPESHELGLQGKPFWLIDPLDGTKEFISRNGEFTCNLALIEQGRSTLGLVSVPIDELIYIGGNGLGASKIYRNQEPTAIRCMRQPGVTRVVASKSHLNEATESFINSIETEVELIQVGSSLKLLRIAEAMADIYPRLAPTCEWDIAAGHAVLEGAGGRVLDLNKEPLRYGKVSKLNPYFIASNEG